MSGVGNFVKGRNHSGESTSSLKNGRLTPDRVAYLQSLKQPPSKNGIPQQRTNRAGSPAMRGQVTLQYAQEHFGGNDGVAAAGAVGDAFLSDPETDFDKTGLTDDTLTGRPLGQHPLPGFINALDLRGSREDPYDLTLAQNAFGQTGLNSQSAARHVQLSKHSSPSRFQPQNPDPKNPSDPWGVRGPNNGRVNSDAYNGFNGHVQNGRGIKSEDGDVDSHFDDDGYEEEEETMQMQVPDVEQQFRQENAQVTPSKRSSPHEISKKHARQSQIRGEHASQGLGDFQRDFTDSQLRKMKFEELEKDTPWDDQISKSMYQLPDILKDKSIAERVDFYTQRPDDDDNLPFYSSLTRSEWDEAGDHILHQIADVFKKLNSARTEKRKLMEKYDRALQIREARIREESAEIDREMEEMRNGGEGLIRGKK